MLSRRGLITGLISLAAAPAIVRASSLMPVKVIEPVRNLYGDGMAATIWYMDVNAEFIAFNKFFARVEFPNGR